MPQYNVKIEEKLVRVVPAEADSPEEAERMVSDEWHCGEHILYAEDFQGVEFTASEIER